MKNSFLITIWLLAAPAFAQQPQAVSKKHSDPEATLILNDLQKKLNACATLSIDFAFQSEKNGKTTEEMKGNIKVKGTKYALSTKMQEVYCDGVTVWNYLPEQKEVTLSAYSEEEDSQVINPLSLIKNYAKNYRSHFIKESLNKGVLEQIIDLTPLKSSSLYKIRLVIDKNKKQIIRITLSEKDGMQYTYVVTKFLANQPVDDRSFVFEAAKHPGVEVIDMR